MVDRIHRMANRTWDIIGGDILTVMEEMGEGNIMSKDEVIESVSDADYMMTHGNDKEAYEAWKKIPTWEERQNILKGAFLHERYGW